MFFAGWPQFVVRVRQLCEKKIEKIHRSMMAPKLIFRSAVHPKLQTKNRNKNITWKWGRVWWQSTQYSCRRGVTKEQVSRGDSEEFALGQAWHRDQGLQTTVLVQLKPVFTGYAAICIAGTSAAAAAIHAGFRAKTQT